MEQQHYMSIRNNQRTRLLLELRVGKTHLVEVLVFIRSSDRVWFHQPPIRDVELLDLLSRRVIPREFGKQIEDYHARKRPDYQQTKAKKKKDGATIGAGNNKKKSTNTASAGAKRKRGGKKKAADEEDNDDAVAERPRRPVTHVYNENLHITYRLEDIKSYEGASLIVLGDAENPRFRRLTKFNKRVVLWCYPPSKEDAMEPDDEDGGFPRPEMILMSEIFRQPCT